MPKITLLSAFLLFGFGACQPSLSGSGDGGLNGGNDLSGGTDSGDGSGGLDSYHPPDSGPPPRCSAASQYVYVVDENKMFSSFSPNQKDINQSAFRDLGVLNCPNTTGMHINSMSVDRNADAWVYYMSNAIPYNPALDKIFKVDTTTLGCNQITGFVGGQQGLGYFGMGFVSKIDNTDEESLFLSSGIPNSRYLGNLDPNTLIITKLGALDGQPELSGTGDAHLYGFFPDPSNPRVSEMDQRSGKETHAYRMPSIAGLPRDWAFAFWGGDFWVFLRRQGEASTTVWHYRVADGSIEQLPTTGRSIVGAGVSTCAPTHPIF